MVEKIKQTVAVASVIERLTPQDAYQRAMAQMSASLAEVVEVRTDKERHRQYADVSYFIAKDPFLAAAAVAAAHIVGAAASRSQDFNADVLTDFIRAQLDEGNTCMKPALSMLRAAAKQCNLD